LIKQDSGGGVEKTEGLRVSVERGKRLQEIKAPRGSQSLILIGLKVLWKKRPGSLDLTCCPSRMARIVSYVFPFCNS
jgi:hypothetical protein